MLARRADPEALFFQALDRLGEVRDLRHVDVGNRAGRAFVRRRRYVRRALVGDDDAGSPNRLGGAGDGAQVARVGDVVEDDDERRAAVFGSLRVRSLHDSRDVHVVEGLGFRHNALVAAAFGELLETRARHRFHRHVALLRLAQHVLDQGVALHVVGKQDALARHLGAQRFDDGAFPFDEISHVVRFRGWLAPREAADSSSEQVYHEPSKSIRLFAAG